MRDVIEKMNMKNNDVFGQTDLHPCTQSSADDPLEVRVGTGHPLPAADAKVDPHGADLPDEQDGNRLRITTCARLLNGGDGGCHRC